MVGKRVRSHASRAAGLFIIGVAAIMFVAAISTMRPFAGIAEAQTAVDVWWPVNGVTVSGTQPIKGMVQGQEIEQYRMYWSVDGGQLVEMWNDYRDYPHKEQAIDFTNWNWRGKGPYVITLTAKDSSGRVIAESTTNVYVYDPDTAPGPNSTLSIKSSVKKTETTTVTASSTPAPTSTSGSHGLYVAPSTNASRQADAWRSSRPEDAKKMEYLAKQPVATWFGGWNADIKSDVKVLADAAAKAGTTPVMVAYNLPHRDCGGYSAGGTAHADAYRQWIHQFSEGIGSNPAIVILEPDALASMNCLTDAQKSERMALLSGAIQTLQKNGKVKMYLDAGHSSWVPAADIASRLVQANVTKAAGFAVNVSNFRTTDESVAYGESVSNAIKTKTGSTMRFVVDTARNGQGPLGSEWCNPSGRGLGKPPTLSTGKPLVDGYFWIKTPGESDGNCNGGPNAGVWWPEYALGLVEQRAQ